MVDINYDAMWDEIYEEIQTEFPAKKQDHEKTIKELKGLWGTTPLEIEKAVQKLLSEGKLGTRTAKSKNGKLVTVYFPM